MTLQRCADRTVSLTLGERPVATSSGVLVPLCKRTGRIRTRWKITNKDLGFQGKAGRTITVLLAGGPEGYVLQQVKS